MFSLRLIWLKTPNVMAFTVYKKVKNKASKEIKSDEHLTLALVILRATYTHLSSAGYMSLKFITYRLINSSTTFQKVIKS